MKITDEIWSAFMLAWEAAPDNRDVVLQARFALEAVAPLIRAQGEVKGIRETIRELEDNSQLWTHKARAVVEKRLAHAAKLEKATP